MIEHNGQPGLAGAVRRIEPAFLLQPVTARGSAGRVIETIVVAAGTIAGVGLLNSTRWTLAGFAIPALLVTAALLPASIRRSEFPRLGLTVQDSAAALSLVVWMSLFVMPAGFLGMWFLTFVRMPIPLTPALPEQGRWLGWTLYQFLYVAVGEELFFRGYVQTNITHAIGRLRWKSANLGQYLGIAVSAAVFAVAHLVTQGHGASLLTFFPGLLLGWLFARSGSLLAPILFHGLANTCYAIATLVLA
jgi:membrane protease YdiL (CAAX protease family)